MPSDIRTMFQIMKEDKPIEESLPVIDARVIGGEIVQKVIEEAEVQVVKEEIELSIESPVIKIEESQEEVVVSEPPVEKKPRSRKKKEEIKKESESK